MLSNLLGWELKIKVNARNRVDLKAIMTVKLKTVNTFVHLKIKNGIARSKIWRYWRTNGLSIYSNKVKLKMPMAFNSMILVLNWYLPYWYWRVDSFLTKHPIIMEWFNMDIHLIWWVWRLALNMTSSSNLKIMTYSSIQNGLKINSSLLKSASARTFCKKFY